MQTVIINIYRPKNFDNFRGELLYNTKTYVFMPNFYLKSQFYTLKGIFLYYFRKYYQFKNNIKHLKIKINLTRLYFVKLNVMINERGAV